MTSNIQPFAHLALAVKLAGAAEADFPCPTSQTHLFSRNVPSPNFSSLKLLLDVFRFPMFRPGSEVRLCVLPPDSSAAIVNS